MKQLKAILFGAGGVVLLWFISSDQEFILMQLNLCAVGIGALLYLETTR